MNYKCAWVFTTCTRHNSVESGKLIHIIYATGLTPATRWRTLCDSRRDPASVTLMHICDKLDTPHSRTNLDGSQSVLRNARFLVNCWRFTSQTMAAYALTFVLTCPCSLSPQIVRTLQYYRESTKILLIVKSYCCLTNFSSK